VQLLLDIGVHTLILLIKKVVKDHYILRGVTLYIILLILWVMGMAKLMGKSEIP